MTVVEVRSAHRARSGHAVASGRNLTKSLPGLRADVQSLPARLPQSEARPRPRRAAGCCSIPVTRLDARALEHETDVLRLGLAGTGVDLANDVDGRGGDRRGHAALAALRHDVAVHVVDLGRAPLRDVLPHRGAPVASAGRGRREHAIERVVYVAAIRGGPLIDGGAVELRDLVTERQPDARRLRAEVDRDRAADLARGDLGRPEPGHGLDGIARGVRAELGPALAPEVVGHQRAVDHLAHLGDLVGARGDLAVVLADAEHVVPGALALLGAPLDLTGLPERHADLRHDQAERARGTGDRGHDRIGPAVLGRDDVALGLDVPKRQLRGPRRVVDLHGDECQVEVARHTLRLIEMKRFGMRLERVVRARHRDALLANRLDLLGPGIDEGHVVAGP